MADGETTTEEIKQFNLRLPAKTLRRIKFLAAGRGQTIQAFTEHLIDEQMKLHTDELIEQARAYAERLEQQAKRAQEEANELEQLKDSVSQTPVRGRSSKVISGARSPS